jgi:hypothetical protein
LRKRDYVKIPGLYRYLYSKIKQEYFDLDYLNDIKNDKEALLFIGKFMDEDLNARFTKNEENLFKSDEEKRASYNRNNFRNRDIMGIARATGMLVYRDVQEFIEQEELISSDTNSAENALIELIDAKREAERNTKK